MSLWGKLRTMMGWLHKEKQKLAFASVQRISYAMIVEVWVRRESALTPEALQQLQTLSGSQDS